MASDRVVVVSHDSLAYPLKVFDHDEGNGWERAEDWRDASTYSEDRTNISSARVA